MGKNLAERELKGDELTFTLLTMLIGVEGKDFCYYKFDTKWWESRLYSRIN